MMYTLPPGLDTGLRPDMVCHMEKTTIMIQLTVPFKSGLEEAMKRKEAKYMDLVETWRSAGGDASLITLEVGSHGFIHKPGFKKLKRLTKSTTKQLKQLEMKFAKEAIISSKKIFCSRNHDK